MILERWRLTYQRDKAQAQLDAGGLEPMKALEVAAFIAECNEKLKALDSDQAPGN